MKYRNGTVRIIERGLNGTRAANAQITARDESWHAAARRAYAKLHGQNARREIALCTRHAETVFTVQFGERLPAGGVSLDRECTVHLY